MELYIGNINFLIEEKEIKKLFEVFGTVDQVTLVRDRITNRSKGFAFINFPDEENAQKAIKGMNGYLVAGRKLVVYPSHNKEEKQKNAQHKRDLLSNLAENRRNDAIIAPDDPPADQDSKDIGSSKIHSSETIKKVSEEGLVQIKFKRE